jgi:hypothetical protein
MALTPEQQAANRDRLLQAQPGLTPEQQQANVDRLSPREVAPDPVIQDLPTPRIDQATQDQNFITNVQNTPTGELTPGQLDELVRVKNASAEAGLSGQITDVFDPKIAQAAGAVTGFENELVSTTASEQERVAAEQANAMKLLEDIFAPRFSQLEKAGAREQGALQSIGSFQGVGRGNRTQDKIQVAIDAQSQREQALAAEKALQARLITAQIQGESDVVIKGIQDQLTAAKTNVQDLDLKLAEAQSQLQADLSAIGSESSSALLDFFTGQASATQAAGQIDLEISSSLGGGLARNSQGDILVDANGEAIPLAPGASEFDIEKIGKNVFGVLNKQTGEVTPIGNVGGGGGGGAGGAGGGTTQVNEDLLNRLEQISSIAEGDPLLERLIQGIATTLLSNEEAAPAEGSNKLF